MIVTRYSCHQEYAQEYPMGDYVLFDDYEYVSDENKRLLEDVEQLQERLRDVEAAYRELKDKVTQAYLLY